MTSRVLQLASELVIDGRPAPLKLVANPRAKRLIVRVDRTGTVVVTAPSKAALPKALAFAESRKDWIRQQISASHQRIPFAPGARTPFFGEPHVIRRDDLVRGVVVERRPRPQLVVGGDAAAIARRVREFYKREAREALAERCDRYAAGVRRRRGKITLRDTRSRWGSCSANGDLSFSWRLVMAPPFVIDYVAAHECAHLARMDHSPAFWRLVADLVGDADPAKRWLRENGARLHAYG